MARIVAQIMVERLCALSRFLYSAQHRSVEVITAAKQIAAAMVANVPAGQVLRELVGHEVEKVQEVQQDLLVNKAIWEKGDMSVSQVHQDHRDWKDPLRQILLPKILFR